MPNIWIRVLVSTKITLRKHLALVLYDALLYKDDLFKIWITLFEQKSRRKKKLYKCLKNEGEKMLLLYLMQIYETRIIFLIFISHYWLKKLPSASVCNEKRELYKY